MMQMELGGTCRAVCWLAVVMLASTVVSARTADPESLTVRAGGIDGVRIHFHRPAPASVPAPVLVYLHGGGWVTGSGSQFSARAKALVVRTGWNVVTVDYPLVGDPLASTEGVQAALCTLLARASTLGIDGGRVALAGASAGGQLAVAAVLADAAAVPECRGVRRDTVQALLLFGPVLQTEGKWSRRYGRDLATVSPITLVSVMLPPTLIMQGTADRTTPLAVAERFVERARRVGAPAVELVLYPGRDHDFHQREDDRDASDAMDRAVAFLRALGWP